MGRRPNLNPKRKYNVQVYEKEWEFFNKRKRDHENMSDAIARIVHYFQVGDVAEIVKELDEEKETTFRLRGETNKMATKIINLESEIALMKNQRFFG